MKPTQKKKNPHCFQQACWYLWHQPGLKTPKVCQSCLLQNPRAIKNIFYRETYLSANLLRMKSKGKKKKKGILAGALQPFGCMGVGRSLPCCFVGKATKSFHICAFSFLCLSPLNRIGEGSSRCSGTQSAAGLLILASSMGVVGKTCNTAFRQPPTLTSTQENQDTQPRQKNPEQVRREGFILRLFRTLVWEARSFFKFKY